MTEATGAPAAGRAPGLHLQAVRLEQFSVGWMLIEAGVAVTAGIIAGSLALTSFGFDSVIEIVSATLVLSRLRAELRGSPTSEQAERRVLKIIAGTFFILAAYVLTGSAIDLATQAHPERSPVGIGLTAGSLLVMPLLGWRKRRVGTALRNQLVLADAAETILCATLAVTTLLGLVLFAAFGWWWADPVAALAVAWFAVREGREAWHGELACGDC
jgi:divalent metal cation (Fe/Co/Zn/Cd) transporter